MASSGVPGQTRDTNPGFRDGCHHGSVRPVKRALALFVLGSSALLVSGGSLGCVVLRSDHDALVARTERLEKESKDENAKLRSDLEATRQRLDNALRASADSNLDVMSSKQRLNDLAGRLDETAHETQETKRELGATRTEIYARLDDLKRGQAPVPEAKPAAAIPADKAAHFAAIRDAVAKKDHALVRQLGPEYVNRYPTDDLADDALLFVGDADLADGRPSSALASYGRLLKLFPKTNVQAGALFGMGEAYMAMHDCANAKLAYEAVEKRAAKEKVGADAKARLATIATNAPGTCAPQ